MSAAALWQRTAQGYGQFKRSVVWLVKQADSHLCDLDRKIEKRILARAAARAEGNYEQISQEQSRLGELCVEHKARLDSMLFFWVLGGAISVTGWASAAASRADISSAAAEPPNWASIERQKIVEAVRQELRGVAQPPREPRVVVQAPPVEEMARLAEWQRWTAAAAAVGCAASIAALWVAGKKS